LSDYAERQEILQAKANYGFTRQGGAIVDIGWFTGIASKAHVFQPWDVAESAFKRL
jgi:hypothetical protein